MTSSHAPQAHRTTWARTVLSLAVTAAVALGAVFFADVFGAGAAALGRNGATRSPAVEGRAQPERRADADRAPLHVAPGAKVVLWGDSLSSEAQQPFVDALRARTGGKLDVSTRTFGGTATCDWLPEIAATTARERIAFAVLEFSGNALTTCMTGADGAPLSGTAYLDTYRNATLQAITMLQNAGARVYVIGTPTGRTPSPGNEATKLLELYREIARRMPGVAYVDAGRAVLAPNGSWTETLPCRPDEGAAQGCTGGRIVVRAPDGAHFCPGAGPALRGVTATCPRWSSGAIRFGAAMAAPVAADARIS
jgi:hypothetical protein